ncbi:TPR repeat-containing protein [Tieghemostelium lacteum]|uniref:TPR repeat-containing protein n=1 Tax=Tieghemostelium lacteum TaxID=361077 RepID=A0A152A9W0_TIELA|nr:TPR repeat-containing protein [Tieghemostelium lacteum]|eukprot:KYR03009.1 TPR repeat-containing protein [Tieghemostelium lacteum]
MEQLNKGNSYFVDESFDEALECYNKACQELPNNVEAFVKRSQCNHKLGNLKEALSDINQAIKLDENNSKSYLKKGQISFELEDYDTALKAFEKGSSLDSENSQFKTWIRKSKAELESAKPSTATTATTSTTTTTTAPVKPQEPVKPSLPIPSSGGKVRSEWYQTATHVILTIYAKFVTADNSSIKLQQKSVGISFKMATGSEYVYDVDFFDEINTQESTIQYYQTKVEIKMKKSRGIRWESLEYQETKAVVTEEETETTKPAVKGVISPYTSKKNWDEIKTEDDKVDGDAALNKVFRDIYSRGSEEQQRAMMKSFVESGGTVLSTNWDEVGQKKVEGSAPKGMEMREWEKQI